MQKDWVIQECEEDSAARLSAALDIHPITAKILLNRGISSADQAEAYLYPKLSDIADPFSLPDMEQAVSRIAKAIRHREKITIFGDYDVDGITGAALMKLFLMELGIKPDVILPNRFDGYGLTESGIEAASKLGTNLLITVDNGIRAIHEVEIARKLGIDVLVTDHHELGDCLPDACVVINPHRLGKDHPLRDISGCGVAFLLLLALRKHMRDIGELRIPEPNLRKHLDLVALGTVADVVPLCGTNRILAKFGIAEIANTSKPGIRALMDVSGTNPSDINPGTIGFRLAPRLNAAGRIGNPQKALDLLLSTDYDSARDIASELDLANRQRQNVEQEILSQIDAILNSNPNVDGRNALVLDSDNWHLGVIGITASKISEKRQKPTVVISRDTSPARGSARSIDGLNLIDALSRCSDLLIGYGGHAMAAGITIDQTNIPEFNRRFDKACGNLKSSSLKKKIKIDAAVEPGDITSRLMDELSTLRPFGFGNPEPQLLIENASILDLRIVGDNHLKMSIGKDDSIFDTIGFNMGNLIAQDVKEASLVFVPEYNTWNGNTSIQLKIKDIRICSK